MNYKILFAVIIVLITTTLIFTGCSSSIASGKRGEPPVSSVKDSPTPAAVEKTANLKDDEYKGEKIVKTEEQWRKELTAEQFYVLREKGTERAFTGELADNHEDGDYYCAACHLKLFSSAAKFESGTGWPSFYQPIAAANVTEETDTKFGMTRTEVLCSRCHSHLGHVFDDGPEPTGLRYCMNSAALKFEKRK